jgi:carbon-monoxide dehydrogenase large subunit
MSDRTMRREDPRLLTGSGRYTADWIHPGQLYAFFLRSDRAHAEIASIDTAGAKARKGVRLVLTGEDYAASGWKSLPGGVPYEGVGGQKQKKPFWPALAQGKALYVGQPVALVVADSVALAQDASEDIAVEYRELAPVIGFDSAVREGAAQLHADVPGNLAFEYETGDRAAVDAAFAKAAHVSRFTLRSQRLVGNPIEPRAFLASFDAASGVFTVHSPSQGMNNMRGFLSAATGHPVEKIRVITELVGGSFGIRSFSYPEHVACMLASQKLARPVKWVATRSEVFLSDNHGRGLTMTAELALDRDGKFLALRFEDCADLGAFSTPFGPQIGTRNITVTMGGVYRIPAMYAHARCAYSNAVSVSAYRGAGRPDIACAVECVVAAAAAEHGFDPVELRRKNFIPPDAMPYKTANGTVYDCGEFEAVMDKALALSDWKDFPARRERSKREGKLRGIGIATFLEISAPGLVPKDQAHARFDRNGELHVYTVSQSTGQGHETAFARILRADLGTDQHVHFHEGDPDLQVVGNGTGGSRSLYGAGSAVKLLGPRLVETAKPLASAELGADAQYQDGKFLAGAKSIGFFELAKKLAVQSPHPMDCVAEGSFGATFPNGCHIAELEIEPETGTVEVVRYTTVDDIGTVVDHTSVEGQVHGGVLQGVGQVLAEHALYDGDTGQLLAGSFMDYPMPRADWMRSIVCDEHSVPTTANALGSKGVGESGTSGALGATLNAVADALRPLGVAGVDMPVTPDKIWRALREAGKRK